MGFMTVSPINQTQIEDPFEGSVHSFDNILNTNAFGARYLHPNIAEGVGPAAGGTFPPVAGPRPNLECLLLPSPVSS